MRERKTRREVPEHAALEIDIPGLGVHQFRLVDPVRLLRYCEAAARVGSSSHEQAAISSAAVGWFWAHPDVDLEAEPDDDPTVYGERVSSELFDEGWSLVQLMGTGSALMRAAQESMPTPEEVGSLVDFIAARAGRAGKR
jgi:hypothetical protein